MQVVLPGYIVLYKCINDSLLSLHVLFPHTTALVIKTLSNLLLCEIMD